MLHLMQPIRLPSGRHSLLKSCFPFQQTTGVKAHCVLHALGCCLDCPVVKRLPSYKRKAGLVWVAIAAMCRRRLRLYLQASRDEQWATRSTGTGDMMGDRLSAATFDEGPGKGVVLTAAYPKPSTVV